jgi:JmjC domain, hydroxylase
MRTYSWSSNICGEKRWFLVQPRHTYLLYDCFGLQLASHLQLDLQFPGMEAFFPGLARARQVAIEVLQLTGETLFVPSNWFHTVENMADTLSINHNWFNGANLELVWRHVESEANSYRSKWTEHAHFGGANATASTISETIPATTRWEEDVQLIWHAVTTKAASVVSSADAAARVTGRVASDLRAIQLVMDRIVALIHAGAISLPSMNIDDLSSLQHSITQAMSNLRENDAQGKQKVVDGRYR